MKGQNILMAFVKMKQRKTDQSITAVPSSPPSVTVNTEDFLTAADS
jgi:hypothetical protein